MYYLLLMGGSYMYSDSYKRELQRTFLDAQRKFFSRVTVPSDMCIDDRELYADHYWDMFAMNTSIYPGCYCIGSALKVVYFNHKPGNVILNYWVKKHNSRLRLVKLINP